jgi:hypothetical protein
MATVNANYNFQVDSDGTNFKFTYQKGKYGVKAFFGLFFFFAILGLPITGIIISGKDFAPYFISWAVIAFGIPSLLIYIFNKKRSDGEFTITPSKFIVKGNEYDREHINSLFIKDPKSGKPMNEAQTSGGYVIVGTGATGMFMAGAAVAGLGKEH